MEDEHLIPQENESQQDENFTDIQSDEVVDGVVDTVEDGVELEQGDDSVAEEAEVEPILTVADVVSEDSSATGEDAEEVVVPVVKKKSDKKWYSLRVISGKEKKIKERIELELQRNKWENSITQVLVPTEKVYKIRAGKKVILERNILPGYILIEAVPSKFRGEMVTAIANIPNVIHFLGRNHPIPMHQSEANRMLGKVDESQDMSASMIEPFIIGETVKIIDGPFKDFVGDIKEVNEERKKMKVIVKIFGRGTEVELNFMQVEKQS